MECGKSLLKFSQLKSVSHVAPYIYKSQSTLVYLAYKACLHKS